MNDTVKLLKECDSGCRTAIDGMSQAIMKVTSPTLKADIASSTEVHAELGKRCHHLLNSNGISGGEPPAMGEMMMKTGTALKLAIMPEDKKIAKMMADGANMGIQSITKILSACPEAESESKRLAEDIIKEEKNFYNTMLNYL